MDSRGEATAAVRAYRGQNFVIFFANDFMIAKNLRISLSE